MVHIIFRIRFADWIISKSAMRDVARIQMKATKESKHINVIDAPITKHSHMPAPHEKIIPYSYFFFKICIQMRVTREQSKDNRNFSKSHA